MPRCSVKIEALEEEHRIKEYNLAKGKIERHQVPLNRKRRAWASCSDMTRIPIVGVCLFRMQRVKIIA